MQSPYPRVPFAKGARPQKSKPRPHRQAGFTLLEVVVACVLLATLVVSALLATSTQQQKLGRARDRLQASHIADNLLGRWHDSRDGIPRQGAGVCPEATDFYWQTQVTSSASVLGSVYPVIRLKIYRTGSTVSLLSVDVLASKEAS